MAAVDLATHPGHLARRLQQAHYLLWNTMVSEETTSPQYAVLNALVAEPGLDQRTVGSGWAWTGPPSRRWSAGSAAAGCSTRSATRRTAAGPCSGSPTRACASTAGWACASPG